MPRFRSLLPMLTLLGACSTNLPFSLPTPITAPPPVPAGERDARYDACRAEATRVVQFRDRGQLMRTDETESSRGVLGVTPFSRLEAERGAAQIDRDRLVAECMRGGPATPARRAESTGAGTGTGTGTANLALGRALPPPAIGTR